MRGPLSLLTGRSNPELAKRIAKSCGAELRAVDVRTFSDGELSVEVKANVRGHDVFVIQSISPPANDHLMELLIILDALKRASASRITAVIPYFGYARQDRKVKPRTPITAKLVADLIVAAGAHRVLTMDLHAGQIMGFFNIPVDNLYARPVLIKELKKKYSSDVCVVSPDSGGVPRARAYAKRLNASLAIIDKRRVAANEVAEMHVVGDVKGKKCILIDDIVDTGGTLAKAASALKSEGAVDVIAACSHAVLSGAAKEKLPQSDISSLYVSDTIAHSEFRVFEDNADGVLDIDSDSGFVKQLSVAQLIGEAIKRIHLESSVSSLFEED